jgi:predicted O-methyltransferase YrrM
MSLLPAPLRRLTPDRLRHDQRLRAFAVGSGLIPPRTMHSDQEAELLTRLGRDAGRVVEIGVYEGSSAVALAKVMGPAQELHLIDPFGHHAGALPPGWGATEHASRRVVARAARGDGPQVHWHVAFSFDVAPRWSAPIDLLFIDGDHLQEGVQRDWDDWHGFIAPGGHVLFHDAREGREHGRGLPGPTAVVNALLRSPDGPPDGWAIAAEVDRTVAVQRTS